MQAYEHKKVAPVTVSSLPLYLQSNSTLGNVQLIPLSLYSYLKINLNISGTGCS